MIRARMKTAQRRAGSGTIKFDSQSTFLARGVVGGPLEGDGPVGPYLDHAYSDQKAGQSTFETAEREMMLNACFTALNAAGLCPRDVDLFLAGDLLNQTVTSNYCALHLGVPLMGLSGACSTLAESLTLGSSLVSGGFASRVMVAVSSHNGAAERQYRYPTEYGLKRPPWAQWTVTGAGAAILGAGGDVAITHATPGRVLDMAVRDPFDLGAAMAPAALDTLVRHLDDTQQNMEDYDMVLTGDLGKNGHHLMRELAESRGIRLGENLRDCGLMIYDLEGQGVFSGGSGAACSAIVTLGRVLSDMVSGRLRRVLLLATGALHSPTLFQQGENIPGIAHAVVLEKQAS